MKRERIVNEIGCFVKNTATNYYELLVTADSEILARCRAKEKAEVRNRFSFQKMSYDVNDMVLKHRTVNITEEYTDWNEDVDDDRDFMVNFETSDWKVFERLKKNLTENGIETFQEEKENNYILRFCCDGEIDYIYTDEGRENAETYIREMKAKRKEILDANKDSCDETNIPDVDEILENIGFIGIDSSGEYYNGWGVTDNYDADYPICLKIGRDFLIKKEES